MKCNECGEENRDDAKFCAHCGMEVKTTARTEQSRVCTTCGFGNTGEAKFCADCGADLQIRTIPGAGQRSRTPKRKDRQVAKTRRWHSTPLLVAGLAGVVLLMALALKREYEPAIPASSALVENRSRDPKIEIRVQEVASKFACSCGTCNELPLDTCSCAKAVEERQFIRDRIQSGQANDQIVQAVNSTYGWMKKEDAVTSTSPSQKSRETRPEGREAKRALAPAGMDVTVATSFDRTEIFSHFTCPCGQCGIDELKDCNCDHPRGAKEVKAFVDQKIDQKKYTSGQLIGMVEKQYGNRKF